MSRDALVTFHPSGGHFRERAHGPCGQDQFVGMPRERHCRHFRHLQCILVMRCPRAAAVELRTPDRLRPRRACSRSEVRGVDFSLAYVLWSLDHVAVQWTCGVALDAVLGVLGVVRDAVLLELCPSARAQNARDVIMLDISG